MDTKICDLCLKESNKIVILGNKWQSWGWSNSGIRRIHYCDKHNTVALRKMTRDDFRTMIYEIDAKYNIPL